MASESKICSHPDLEPGRDHGCYDSALCGGPRMVYRPTSRMLHPDPGPDSGFYKLAVHGTLRGPPIPNRIILNPVCYDLDLSICEERKFQPSAENCVA